MLEMLRTESRPRCAVCGSAGRLAYDAVPDLMLGHAGAWRIVCCCGSHCGTLWLDPRPVEEDLGKIYENFITHDAGAPLARRTLFGRRVRAVLQQRALGYPADVNALERIAATLFALVPSRAEFALRELMYMPYRAGGRLLDIGCGNGRQLERYAQAGWKPIGVDFDEEAVATARKLGLDVRLGDLWSQTFEDASFDAILMSHVIEHVPDPLSLLTECRRVLKPGGNFIIVTPNANAFGRRVYRRHWLGLEPPRHLNVYTRTALRKLATDAGFVERRLHTPWVMAPGWFLASQRRREAEASGTHASLPAATEHLPASVLAWSAIEAVGCVLGIPWGEEIVLQITRRS